MAMMGRILLLSGFLVLGQAHAATQPQANLHALDAVPRFALDGAAVAKAVATAEQGKSRPLRFAVTMDLPLTLSDGRWKRWTPIPRPGACVSVRRARSRWASNFPGSACPPAVSC